MEKYADPERARKALAKLAANRLEIHSWMLPTPTLINIASGMAHTYISSSPKTAREWLLSLGDTDAREQAVEALSWQMIGANGSDAQRELSNALAWAEGWANQ